MVVGHGGAATESMGAAQSGAFGRLSMSSGAPPFVESVFAIRAQSQRSCAMFPNAIISEFPEPPHQLSRERQDLGSGHGE